MLLIETTGEFRGFSVGEGEAIVGYVAPDPADQIVGLSVEAELEWAWSRSRLDEASPPDELRDFIEKLDLASLMERSTGKLSSGQRQRVALASIAIADPDLLVLDNCFSSLDRRSVDTLIDFIERRTDRGLSTWLAGRSHLSAARNADRCFILSAGRLLWTGATVGSSLELDEPTKNRRRNIYWNLASGIERHCSRSMLKDVATLDSAELYLPSELGDRPRLDIEHFHAGPGEITGIRGDNGSGKSSLLSALAGLETLPKRKVLWGREDPREGRLCYLPPDGIPAWIARLDRDEIWPAASVNTDIVLFLSQLLREDRYAPIADGAYRSRENPWRRLWWIASSVHADVGWLLLDEPTTGMDAQQEECLRRIILAHGERGGGALIVSHDHDFLRATCRRLITVEEGRIRYDSRSDALSEEWILRGHQV
ncbi:MAG TPA: ATP-binding cassette domain-containing protein [Thermoanaerobaculia bacterium]|nr:ATP-binding cassette domain-containing protein [Thermoanaerobaculia bacterium]